MSNPYAAVLQPGTLGTLTLRNRIVMAPMGSNFAEADGHCSERIQAYYEARAKGGAGLLIMGVCAIAYPAGTAEPYQVGLSRDEFLPGLRALAERVHRHGARIGAQLQHAGKTATRDMAEGRELWVPSLPPVHRSDMLDAFTPEELSTFVGGLGKSRPKLREMDEADIATMIGWFADAAARAQAAGFDMVEVHAAHTYILAGFLSPHYNRRTDRWGGPLENRARLLVEVIRAIKARCGAGFPVSVRLDGEELRTEGGITLADCVAAAQLAVAAGADAIHASAYATITSGTAFTEAPLPQAPRAFVGYAQALKAAVKVPVIAVGRIEADEAATDIAAGRYDFIAMARKMLADPAIPIKLAENRPHDIRPCIYCYTCVSQIFINQRVKCAVNAETGHEHDSLPQPAAQARHVVVVGGGPAGMEAARVAAERGHRVTLIERSDRLGGTLFFAALAYPENGRLLDNLVAQMAHPRITVALGTVATPEAVLALRPDHLVVATGARRAAPAIPGAELRHVWSGDELRRLMTGDGADEIARAKLSLAERALFKAGGMLKVTDSRQALQGLSKLWMPLGQRVAIVGGGLVGLELAEFLLARGRQVTVLEPGAKAGRELAIVRRWRVLDAVRSHGSLHLQAEVQRIDERSVHWRDSQGQTHTLEADSVVLALGAEPDDGPARQLSATGVPMTVIGDGAALGYIEGAIHQGHRAGATV